LTDLTRDLDEVLVQTEGLWNYLRGKRLFVTGGTGFFGRWLLETFAHANARLGLGAEAVVLTRRPDEFRARVPRLAADKSIRLLAGDVRSLGAPDGSFAYVIHAATEASAALNEGRPLEMLQTVADGTRRVLDFALACRPEAVLFTSSGAVYGPQPRDLERIPEEYAGGPDPLDPRAAYAEGKRFSETLFAAAHRSDSLPVKIARGFAFVGPHLPLDRHFAIGNFIADGLAGRPIRVTGDGMAVRSYLYGADLAVWLWMILFRAPSGRAFNVGSPYAVSIAELAHTVSRAFSPPPKVVVAQTAMSGASPQRYVPDVSRASRELGLAAVVPLDEAIRRTVTWNRRAA
jgi:nucleoside-diphosphate-sugar epimerase